MVNTFILQTTCVFTGSNGGQALAQPKDPSALVLSIILVGTSTCLRGCAKSTTWLKPAYSFVYCVSVVS